jgi:cytochrome c5
LFLFFSYQISRDISMSEINLQKIAAYALLIVIGCVAFAGALVAVAHKVSHPSVKPDEEAVNARIAPVASSVLAAASSAGAAASRTGEQLYKTACSACHDSGAAGAPKMGDSAAWAPRLKQGLDGLLKSATAGKNAMPPKGGSDASETELARAIVFVVNKSGGSLKEPAAK